MVVLYRLRSAGARIRSSLVCELFLGWVRLLEGHRMLGLTFIRDLVGGRGVYVFGYL